MANEFAIKLNKYAEVAVTIGLNVQPGDLVTVDIDIDQAEFAHLLIEQAYRTGAKKVLMQWQDSVEQRLDLTYQRIADLQETLPHDEVRQQFIADKRVKRLVVKSASPDALAGIEAAKIQVAQNTSTPGSRAVRQASRNNLLSWTIIAAASPAWAQKVFPNEEAATATEHLWDAIFSATRLETRDPIAAWREQRERLETNAATLNRYQFDRLHYVAPGTDLTIGLPHDHIWQAAGTTNERGEFFIPNLPTEEVFTAPDLKRVDGYISATKPLSYGGSVLEGLKFVFRNGQVVTATATKGQAILDQLLQTDAGAKRLGEVALVPDASPISQSGLIFYNTLFDENASDHLALGAAYPFSIENGTAMNPLQLQKAGLNVSNTHVDFMVGSAQMSIDGITKAGEIVPVFRHGNWA
ncbi:aminopeptidase [Lapidilactobacillus mulanensis]|uniref:Aminopeptidase n=1 Tax=Lapidilactobacillus mulanensis TaxID=2485999 RepID=A0ABW4DLL9_9LACO|nr:aminopeptidase [Lapidilactobacillus mulanensis]